MTLFGGDGDGKTGDGAARSPWVTALLVVAMLVLFYIGYNLQMNPEGVQVSGKVTQVLSNVATQSVLGTQYQASVVVAYTVGATSYSKTFTALGTLPFAVGDRVEVVIDASDPSKSYAKRPTPWVGPAFIFGGALIGIAAFM